MVCCGLRPTAEPTTQGPVTFEFESDPALFPWLLDLERLPAKLDQG